jgi:hypothetical protein
LVKSAGVVGSGLFLVAAGLGWTARGHGGAPCGRTTLTPCRPDPTMARNRAGLGVRSSAGPPSWGGTQLASVSPVPAVPGAQAYLGAWSAVLAPATGCVMGRPGSGIEVRPLILWRLPAGALAAAGWREPAAVHRFTGAPSGAGRLTQPELVPPRRVRAGCGTLPDFRHGCRPAKGRFPCPRQCGKSPRRCSL